MLIVNHHRGDEKRDNPEDLVSDSPKKTLHYWLITLLGWGLVLFLTGSAFYSLTKGDIESFVGFLFFALCVILAMHPPQWFVRFSAWRQSGRGY